MAKYQTVLPPPPSYDDHVHRSNMIAHVVELLNQHNQLRAEDMRPKDLDGDGKLGPKLELVAVLSDLIADDFSSSVTTASVLELFSDEQLQALAVQIPRTKQII
jgi:hypothetical protein